MIVIMHAATDLQDMLKSLVFVYFIYVVQASTMMLLVGWQEGHVVRKNYT